MIPDDVKTKPVVPSTIRKVLEALQMGLDERVTVWYEPLYDPAGEKPHLVVLFPDRGVAVLEVLAARDASLIGPFRGKIRLVRDGVEIEADNPLERAERLAAKLRERIAQALGLDGFQVPVAAMAVMPGVKRSEAEDKELERLVPISACLFHEDVKRALDGSGEAALLRIFANNLSAPARVVTLLEQGRHEKIFRALIQPDTVIDEICGTAKVEQLQLFTHAGPEDRVRVMDRRQEAMAKSFGDGHRVIRGVAGSGKTLLLVYRAKLLARAFPQRRYLLTCYTRALAGQLREMLKEYHNVEVQHLDGLMWDILNQADKKHPGYEHKDSELVAEAALDAVKAGHGPRYHGIFLDEAQDFGTASLSLVKHLLGENCHDLVIVANGAQNIFRRKFSWKQAGIQAQGRTRILSINYRNTEEIMRFATAVLKGGLNSGVLMVSEADDEYAFVEPKSVERSGKQPGLLLVANSEDEVAEVLSGVRAWLAESKEARKVAVLYLAGVEKGFNRAELLYRKLRRANIPVFWANEPDNRSNRDRLAQAEEPVVLATVHSAKGLEFSKVLLCGFWSDTQDSESARKLVYVGMTRATDELIVICPKSSPLANVLQAAVCVR